MSQEGHEGTAPNEEMLTSSVCDSVGPQHAVDDDRVPSAADIEAVRAFLTDPERWRTQTLTGVITQIVGMSVPVQVTRVRSMLTRESDRGCALTGAAFLDEALADLLRAHFVKDSASDEMLDGPLGSFSARIAMCRCLGLLSETTTRNLNLIRKIRNDFAHQVEVSFDSAPIAARCKELLTDPTRPHQGPRDRFTTNILMMAGEIHARTRGAGAPPVLPPPPDLSARGAVVQEMAADLKRVFEEICTHLGPELKAYFAQRR